MHVNPSRGAPSRLQLAATLAATTAATATVAPQGVDDGCPQAEVLVANRDLRLVPFQRPMQLDNVRDEKDGIRYLNAIQQQQESTEFQAVA